ncbi:MAG: histidinol dehydrogenase, partial [Candidatus Euphemobacter frigidus]|nr:histidinol dehydrogenase [Candidatus Euphemobacter frigidus]
QLKNRLNSEAFPPEKLQLVREIIAEVRMRGDRALRMFTLRFDGVDIKSFSVTTTEFRSAKKLLTPQLEEVFRRVKKNIRDYYSVTMDRTWRKGRGDGMTWGEKVTPIERVGAYIPGGKAPLVSTVFMTVVPALLAGVPRIVMVTPPQIDGSINRYILAAANYLGIKEIYKIGGAQAIAALAFGTRSIPKVDKIVGPGNIYVSLAKKEVFGYVDIESVAGPSEIAILADGRANARYITADLLAQAEHGEGGFSILITNSKRLIEAVGKEAKLLIRELGRRDDWNQTFNKGTFLVRVKSIKTGIELVNRIAPEHLEIMTKEPTQILPLIKNAGAIFLGRYSPVAAGDYIAGPSHVLPTGGSARFFSPLSVSDFQKKSSVIRYNRRALKNDLPALQTLAELEGLDAHILSAKIRLGKNL